MRSLILDDL